MYLSYKIPCFLLKSHIPQSRILLLALEIFFSFYHACSEYDFTFYSVKSTEFMEPPDKSVEQYFLVCKQVYFLIYMHTRVNHVQITTHSICLVTLEYKIYLQNYDKKKKIQFKHYFNNNNKISDMLFIVPIMQTFMQWSLIEFW